MILFENSLTLNSKQIPGLGKVIHNQTTPGVLISWAIPPLRSIFFRVFHMRLIVAGGFQDGFTGGVLVSGKMVLISVVCGVGPGCFFSALVRKYWIPQDQNNAASLVLV